MQTDSETRKWLLWNLRGGNAHWTFEDAFVDLAPEKRGARAEGTPYSPWRVLEHMRICQRDILEFTIHPDYESPSYPDEYWPDALAPESDEQWDQSIEQFQRDLQSMQELVDDPEIDLFEPLPQGDGQTVMREAMLVVDHNSYHLGQMELVRRLIGAYPDYEEAPDNL
jgi:uncharacterized damage-inducible protein DinB